VQRKGQTAVKVLSDRIADLYQKKKMKDNMSHHSIAQKGEITMQTLANEIGDKYRFNMLQE